MAVMMCFFVQSSLINMCNPHVHEGNMLFGMCKRYLLWYLDTDSVSETI